MNFAVTSKYLRSMLMLAIVSVWIASHAHGQTETVLHSFAGMQAGDGDYPNGLAFDSSGNLFGTTGQGGTYGYGTVFELKPTSSGWVETVLHSFADGPDGGWPMGGVVVDSSGNLYGATEAGGAFSCYNYIPGCGVIYELSPQADGSWSETVLHNFTGYWDGSEPTTSLILDGSGNIYGGTSSGGAGNGGGVIFRLSPQPHGSWKETVLHTCRLDRNGSYPQNMFLDSAGNLFGTMAADYGLVFKLSPTSSGEWSETILHTFDYNPGKNGGPPVGNLAMDTSGNLYGISFGGGAHYEGVVYELSPTGSGGWGETILHSFGPVAQGFRPMSLVLGSQGDIFGVTNAGGNSTTCFDCGVIFELATTSSGVWKEVENYSFDGSGGATSWGVLIADQAGNVYGTTQGGGAFGYGVVFKYIP